MAPEIGYAKLNLALHVRKRREDGYHELETLFAFCEHGDVLSVEPALRDEVRTVGEFGGHVGDPGDNLVARALSALPHPDGLSITLEKNLPVAAGLGGGSADAGAVFRLVEQLHGLPDDWQDRALKLGADVPACVRSEMAVGRGVGEELAPLDNDLSGTPVLLVNPRIALSTGPVFAAWDQFDRGPLPEGTAREMALEGRNDLEEPAISICPTIAQVLRSLGATSPMLARMSGSGATCFALYEDTELRDAAEREIALRQPGWWRMATVLR
ncbi:4-(cytidine 5'-diphospho)-2-C-methyl-D-erythritol kinase [Citromicrobium bathyomarinum]|uniref:4-(cytidine 5'-diphospho)-2-C-methyl-D-erythritol kinase n=1 Tax=Citromicrobium bathyomarinum TaxID=72174 RepID=UPI00315A0E1C